jgi:repressor LexA
VVATAEPVQDLTRRQRQVLAALRRLHERDGVPPTLREIGAEVGLASASSVIAHVRVLEERGLAERAPGCPRTLRATRARTDADRGGPRG